VAAACAVVPAWSAEPASPLAIPASLPSPAPETPALSRPLLRCQVRYASDTVHLETRPTSAPYEVVPHDIAGRFGFKAVVVGTPAAVDHIALYAYDMAVPQAPVLIHEVVYHPPFPVNPTVPGLTGWNHVYSARLGREMVYGCAFTKGTSP
jgi:hypothetical protein